MNKYIYNSILYKLVKIDMVCYFYVCFGILNPISAFVLKTFCQICMKS